MIERIVVLLEVSSKVNDPLYMLRCPDRSYPARYTVILVTSRDCSHITWSRRNPAFVSLLATFSHRTWVANDFSSSQLSQKRSKNSQIALFENFLTNENFSFLLISCTRNRHSTVIESYIERDDVVRCELDRLALTEIWFTIELSQITVAKRAD
jgi:hypothetical protein